MTNNDTYLRLAKPRPKGLPGLLSLLFSRLLIIAVLILAQIAVFVLFYAYLDEHLPHFLAIQTLFVFCILLWLFSTDMDSAAKLTWMFAIAVFPALGSLLLLFTQTNAGHRHLQKRSREMIERSRGAIHQPPDAWKKVKGDPAGTDDLVHWLNRSGCFPIYDQTRVTYFPLGEKKFEAMLDQLRQAEDYIFMEYFIIEEGYMWGKILEILIEKAAAGVDVRVMYDGMCEISQLPGNYTKLLQARGIRAKRYAPIIPLLSSHYNYRDHRKILVIDGRVAFNGGVNLGDEYINRVERFGHWKDTALMIQGPAVASYTLMFLQMWNLTEEVPDFDPRYFRGIQRLDQPLDKEGTDGDEDDKDAPAAEGVATCAADGACHAADAGNEPAGLVLPYCDCPLDEDKAGETVYMDILNRASSYVHIMTPYLILDGELETALKYAAQRGVDVKLILPGIPDKKAAYALAKSHYRVLTRAGVKIYEYTPGFVHAKVFVSDDVKAVVGTINLDYRSLYHHFECATYLYGTECIADIEADFQDTLAKCRPVTEETMAGASLYYRVMGHLMKFVAPLM